ncbi:MAG: hypothetical protein ACI90V_013966, partial [Bacillariaceae sp.]
MSKEDFLECRVIINCMLSYSMISYSTRRGEKKERRKIY